MIGKIKKFNFESLFILNTFALIVTSCFFNNFIFTGVYILFFFISIFTTKNGLKIIKKFNFLIISRPFLVANKDTKKNNVKTPIKIKLLKRYEVAIKAKIFNINNVSKLNFLIFPIIF